MRVRDGEVTLDGRLDRRSAADLAVRLAGQVSGVVRVVDLMGYDVDDTVWSSCPRAGSPRSPESRPGPGAAPRV
ncbi:BON domain-containing protein [Micromonospora palomenae]|uniref:BON domain-containing protein n=1 Tax=Micromonospora palomenae TaxID=1461247 RepID=UPI001FE87DDB|nr:BON domain-containing protein [Micromonospora palomenae]